MILVFGSINVDVVMPVPHLPAPGETVLGGDYALLPGGKGANQAVSASQVPDALLGPPTVLVAQMELPVAGTAPVIRRARSRGARPLLNLAPAAPLPAGLLSATGRCRPCRGT